jgi:two-component system chemotaxis response regulator CheB
VIAQDEASSVVWGMPGAAASVGACAAVLPPVEIAEAVSKLIKGERP